MPCELVAVIRKYVPQDRASVRRISCETAFLELPREPIFTDDEILADALVSDFIDKEPDSCFVAECDRRVVGYVVGCMDIPAFRRATRTGIFFLLLKAFKRGVFFKSVNLRLLLACAQSALRGEFFMPDFSGLFPATLHINIVQGYRGQGIGRALIQKFMGQLTVADVRGVHFGTFSENAKSFFCAMGFTVLFQGTRSYLKAYLGKEVTFYVLGKKIGEHG